MRFIGLRILIVTIIFVCVACVSALGTSCTAPLGSGSAATSDPYWLQNIVHQGTSPFGPSGYQVFRNVKDFGAKGDGVTDDTAAINAAIQSGGRCTLGCSGESTTPATVFFPQGTYLVSSPIIAIYYTELVGDAKSPPTLKASAGFTGIAVIDADPYAASGANWYINQNNFYRSVRNFHIDLTAMPATTSATGLHWQVSQATSLYNIVVDMSTASNTAHQGIFMENGSGGFMGDLVFNGGKFGVWVGNQQFTVRNITVNNAQTGIFALWNWGWTWQDVKINGCQIGFDMTIGHRDGSSQGAGAEAFIDVFVTDTPIFLRTSATSTGIVDGSIVLDNVHLTNVPIAVGVNGGETVLAGGTTTINSWVQGNIFSGSSQTSQYTQGSISAIPKASSLLDSSGRIFGKTRPTYATYATGEFVSVKSQGAKGDGRTDDTVALQAIFDKFAGCKIIYFDAGVYTISDTLRIPAGVQVVGEAWSTIMASGSAFANQNIPAVAVQIGTVGSTGLAEISGMLFTTRASAGGAILVEWNVHDPSGHQGAAGMWDALFRIGGAAGTNMQTAQCANTTSNTGSNCIGAFLGLHLTSSSSAYLEGTWVWAADHDIEQSGEEVTVYSGRGILSESQGPVWMIGTSEHHVLYQYNIAGAADHYIGTAQTETPYYQPNPVSPAPFLINSAFSDPQPQADGMSWAMNVQSSSSILVFGAGFYSFFQDYQSQCQPALACQILIFNVDSTSSLSAYSVSTVGTTDSFSVSNSAVVSGASVQNGFANVRNYKTS
ncbi:exo-beta-1-3-glucanase [Vararia minispora EC-137]|uniref:Exo-beta-1-3-glucanase n=1 Tax=Vararia minispora EC-137 TaxID=1314806 RepID=A0ACB8QBT1_9AGAM|nr:exo-beta-1-3-glucanase [Vararia minispora EC-137]